MAVVAVEDGERRPAAARGRQLLAGGGGRARRASSRSRFASPRARASSCAGHELALAELADAHRLHAPRGPRPPHRHATRTRGASGPVLYRASIADMVVPYGDPRPTYFHRNAFDVGEYGIGTLANSLENGCDCLGEIRYLDAVVNDSQGRAGDAAERRSASTRRTRASSGSTSTGAWARTEVRRSRRLVVSSIATVGNYEYGFYWYFYQDGTIQLEVKLTGIISNGAEPPGVEAAVGRDGRARRLRAHPPALLQRAPRHDGRRAGQLGLRGQHGRRRARARRTRTTTPSTPRRRCWPRRPRRSGSSTRSPAASGRS